MREIFGVNIVSLVSWSHAVVVLGRSLGRNRLVSCLIKMIMDDLSEIDDTSLLDLNFCPLIELDSGSMNKSEIPDIVLTSLVDDHELGLPKFLVIWNLVVVRFSLSDFEDGSVTLERDLNVLELGSINTFKLKLKGLLREHVWSQEHFSLLHIADLVDVLASHILQDEVAEHWVILKVLHSWIQIVPIS